MEKSSEKRLSRQTDDQPFRSLPMIRIVFGLASVIFLTTAPGCTRQEPEEPKPVKAWSPNIKPPEPQVKEPIAAGDGIIRGQVLFEGELPEMPVIAGLAKHQDHKRC